MDELWTNYYYKVIVNLKHNKILNIIKPFPCSKAVSVFGIHVHVGLYVHAMYFHTVILFILFIYFILFITFDTIDLVKGCHMI